MDAGDIRKTKIIGSVGPSCKDPETIGSMVDSGMDAVRLNFSHSDEDWHKRTFNMLRDVSPEILNITRYSKRPGTEAERRGSQIKGSVMKDRSRQTAAVHAEILRKVLMTRLGRHERCLVTEVGRDGTMMARDINYTPIVIDGGRELLGEFIDVRSSGTGPTYLTGGGDWEMSQ